MTAICDKKFHKHQQRLYKMIADLEAMRVECCNTGQFEARDNLGVVIGHLHLAQAAGGKVEMTKDDGGTVVALGGGGGGK